MSRPPVGVDPPPGFTHIDPFDNIGDATLKADARFAVEANPSSVDPTWTWYYDQTHAGTWLATGLVLKAATNTTTTGNLTATTSTTGSNLDPDGYTVTVDGTTSQPIATNGNVTFNNLAAGNHTVVLSGVATNCTVGGGTYLPTARECLSMLGCNGAGFAKKLAEICAEERKARIAQDAEEQVQSDHAHEQDEGPDHGGDRQPRPAGRPRRQRRRPADDDGKDRERREKQLGIREMDRHPLRRELEDDGDRAEHGLQRVQHGHGDRENERAAIRPVGDERPRDHRRDRQPRDDGEEAMRPLDPRRGVERRQELTVAKRPVGTAEARSGDTHDAAPHHNEERREEARIHESAIAWRKGQAARRANARRLLSADGRCERRGCGRSCRAAAATSSPTRGCRPPTGHRRRSARS